MTNEELENFRSMALSSLLSKHDFSDVDVTKYKIDFVVDQYGVKGMAIINNDFDPESGEEPDVLYAIPVIFLPPILWPSSCLRDDQFITDQYRKYKYACDMGKAEDLTESIIRELRRKVNE